MTNKIYSLLSVFLFLSSHVASALSEERAELACDIDRGKSLFNKCAICHTNAKDAGHLVGPNLYAIVDREVAALTDYVYTDELKAYGEKWTSELLDQFLSSPMTEVPGTTMAFAGFKKEADRRNLLCYLTATEQE